MKSLRNIPRSAGTFPESAPRPTANPPDQITVIGAKNTVDGHDLLLVREIKKGSDVPEPMDSHPRFIIPNGRSYVYEFKVILPVSTLKRRSGVAANSAASERHRST